MSVYGVESVENISIVMAVNSEIIIDHFNLSKIM